MEKIGTYWKDAWNSFNTENEKVIKKAIRESYTTDAQVVVVLNTETRKLSIEYRPHGDSSFYTGGNLMIVRKFDRRNYNTRKSWPKILRSGMIDEVSEVNETLNAVAVMVASNVIVKRKFGQR